MIYIISLNSVKGDSIFVLGYIAFLFTILIVVQYLAFARLNPLSLFNGGLTKRKYSKL